MKLDLADPIWTYLPGAYGVEEVATPLARLVQNWDKDLCTDLLWNRLQHQDSLYPVTWAALPWLWQIAGTHDEAYEQILDFIAHLLTSARATPVQYCYFSGLPLSGADLSHWFVSPPPETLAQLDALFADLAEWGEAWAPKACGALSVLMEAGEISKAARYWAAILSWQSPEQEALIVFLGFVADGWSVAEICNFAEEESTLLLFSDREIGFALDQVNKIETLCPALSATIHAFISTLRPGAAERTTLQHPDQLSLFE